MQGCSKVLPDRPCSKASHASIYNAAARYYHKVHSYVTQNGHASSDKVARNVEVTGKSARGLFQGLKSNIIKGFTFKYFRGSGKVLPKYIFIFDTELPYRER